MIMIFLNDILGKINYHTKLELIEVDYYRLHGKEKRLYITDSFSNKDYYTCKEKYGTYSITNFCCKDNYLQLYIWNGKEAD